MNRAILQRLLLMGVVAPYLYKISGEQDSLYFSIGLKLLAGGIIVMNIEPAINDVKTVANGAQAFLKQVKAAQETLAKNAKQTFTIDAEAAEVVDVDAA